MTIHEERGIRIGQDRVKKNNTEWQNGMQSEEGCMPFFVFGKNRIKISEHFKTDGKTLPELVEEAMQSAIKKVDFLKQ